MGPTKRRLPQCLADLSQPTYEEHLSRKPNIPVITLQVSLAPYLTLEDRPCESRMEMPGLPASHSLFSVATPNSL